MGKVNLKVLSLATVVFSFVFGFGCDAFAQTTNSNPVTSQETDNLVLEATVRVVLFVPVSTDTNEPPRYTFTRGLGSRVRNGSQSLLVTHDHWGDALQTAEFVHLYSTDNELLVELGGDTFRNLVLFRDRGTMLLSAPKELPGVASLGNPEDVKVGVTVTLVHQEAGARPEVASVQLQQAQVKAQDTFDGRPSYSLVSLDEQPVVSGDSGGGLWLDGRLVGNMWATMTGVNWQVWTWESLDDLTTETDESFGAVFPLTDSQQQEKLTQTYRLQQLVFADG